MSELDYQIMILLLVGVIVWLLYDKRRNENLIRTLKSAKVVKRILPKDIAQGPFSFANAPRATDEEMAEIMREYVEENLRDPTRITDPDCITHWRLKE